MKNNAGSFDITRLSAFSYGEKMREDDIISASKWTTFRTTIEGVDYNMPLSDAKIRNAKAKDKRYQLADSDGLYLEVMTSGRKYWRYRYTSNGKRNWRTLGEFPYLGLREAREEREKIRRCVSLGLPFEDGSQSEPLFRDVAAEWHRRHPLNTWRTFELHILPLIGDKKVKDIKTQDVLNLLKRLVDIRSPTVLPKVKSLCSRVFRFAIVSGYTETDPTYALRGVLPTPPSSHLASLTDARDVALLLRNIDAYPNPVVRYAMQFSALTFLRPGEVRHAEWTEIDREKAEMRIPAEKMKMRRPHIVPLARQTLGMLEAVRIITGHGRYVFPNARAPRGDRPMSGGAVLVALRSMGYAKDQMTAHGFRSMASTLLNENGFPPDHIERQLAHVEGNAVRAAYNYAEYLPERRRMMQWWADYLEELATACTPCTGDGRL